MITIKISELTSFINAGGHRLLRAAIDDPFPYVHPLTGLLLTAKQRENMRWVLASNLPHDLKPLIVIMASCADEHNQIAVDEYA